jgi:hypothetical protein
MDDPRRIFINMLLFIVRAKRRGLGTVKQSKDLLVVRGVGGEHKEEKHFRLFSVRLEWVLK